jgi:hypothetical protein
MRIDSECGIWLGTRRRHANTGNITGIAEATAERVRLGGERLQTMAHAIAANEKAQQRFRAVVLAQLSKIQSWVVMIHGAQVAQAHMDKPDSNERMEEHANGAEELVSRQSHEGCLAVLNYVYGEPQLSQGHKRRRKGAECPSYEI